MHHSSNPDTRDYSGQLKVAKVNLQDLNDRIRISACEELSKIPAAHKQASEAIAILGSALTDESPDVKKAALVALREFGSGASVTSAAVTRLIVGDHSSVMGAALDCLSAIGYRAGDLLEISKEALNHENTAVTYNWIKLVQELNTEGEETTTLSELGKNLLTMGESTYEESTLLPVIGALGNLGPAAAESESFIRKIAESSVAVLHDKNHDKNGYAPPLFEAAVTALESIGVEIPSDWHAMAEDIRSQLAEDYAELDEALGPALRQEQIVTGSAVTEVLEEAVEGGSLTLVDQLTLMPGPEHLHLILKLSHANELGRVQACQLLMKLGRDATPAIPRLIEILEDKQEIGLVQAMALWALAEMEERAQSALPAIRALQTSKDRFVIEKVDDAVRRITPRPA